MWAYHSLCFGSYPPKRTGGASEVAYQMGRRRLCPKVELDGIPEFRVLASCMSVVTQKVQAGLGRKPQEKKTEVCEAAHTAVSQLAGGREGSGYQVREVAYYQEARGAGEARYAEACRHGGAEEELRGAGIRSARPRRQRV